MYALRIDGDWRGESTQDYESWGLSRAIGKEGLLRLAARLPHRFADVHAMVTVGPRIPWGRPPPLLSATAYTPLLKRSAGERPPHFNSDSKARLPYCEAKSYA